MTALTLRQRLRIETSAVHERLHQHDQFSAIADGTIRASEFDRLMTRMGGFYAALDPQMSDVCGRIAPDLGGYVYRARSPMFSQRPTSVPDLPKIDDLATLAGAAYVVDGAVLGGQILRRAISGRLSHPYWNWCAEVGPSIWRDTRALIELADRDPLRSDRAVTAANDVFSAFSDHLDMTTEEVAA